MQKLKDEIRNLSADSAQLAKVDFTYRDPVKNFDRSRVKGVVAKLIKVKDRSTLTALEVGHAAMHDIIYFVCFRYIFCFQALIGSKHNHQLLLYCACCVQVAAGGKMFNVVVDTENTGKQLLQNGELRRRVTIIPLNKIQSHPVPLRVQNTAVRLVCLFCLHILLHLVLVIFCIY